VFAAAFLAGAAAAVGLNRTLDVHLAQRQPRVESEPIFVALRSLPQGAPLTVWDVALRDWPKAMLPAAALRPRDSFAGMALKHSIREGQPILSVQLVKVSTPGESQVADASAAAAATAPASDTAPAAEPTDLWAPAEVPAPAIQPADSVSQTIPESTIPAPTTPESTVVEAAAPVVLEPVVVATTTATDIDMALAPAAGAEVAPARDTVMRYLVVPERIALEADRSFVPAVEPREQRVADTVAQSPAAQPSQESRFREQPGRADRPATRASSNRSRQPPRSAAGQSAPAKQPEKQSFLRSMMPSLSVGMGAAEPAPQTPAKPKTAAQPGSRPAQAPPSTFRGFGLFR
jgi:hypothetical protein